MARLERWHSKGVILLGLMLMGCGADRQAQSGPEISARADTLRSLLKLEAEYPAEHREVLALIDLFRRELMDAPVPDTGATTVAGRRRTRVLHQHSLARAFLAGTEGGRFFHLIRGAVAETMLRTNWMSGDPVDSLDAFYLTHSIAGFSPDMDRIIQTLHRLGPEYPSTPGLAREALKNLESYVVVLSEWQSTEPTMLGYGFSISGERTTVAGFLDAVSDNASSLDMYVEAHPEQ